MVASKVRYLSDAEAHLLVCRTLAKERARSDSLLAIIPIPDGEDDS